VITVKVKARKRIPSTKRCRKGTFAALDFFRRKIATSGAVDDILAVVSDTNRGCSTSGSQRASIDAAIGTLEGAGNDASLFNKGLSATWKLLWTTEKETLFIIRNANLFQTTAGEVYQIIDTDKATLQNVIVFPPKGAFVIETKIEQSGDQRVKFEFEKAVLKLPKRDIKLPPYGKGWFDNVYLDSRIRVSKDIRGNVLITARDGPPRSVI